MRIARGCAMGWVWEEAIGEASLTLQRKWETGWVLGYASALIKWDMFLMCIFIFYWAHEYDWKPITINSAHVVRFHHKLKKAWWQSKIISGNYSLHNAFGHCSRSNFECGWYWCWPTIVVMDYDSWMIISTSFLFDFAMNKYSPDWDACLGLQFTQGMCDHLSVMSGNWNIQGELGSYYCCWYPSSPGPRLNIKTVLSTYGDFHVKDKTAVRTSYL